MSSTVETRSAERTGRHAFTEDERARGVRTSAQRRREAARREARARRAWMARERELYAAFQDAKATGGRAAHDARQAWRVHLRRGPGGAA